MRCSPLFPREARDLFLVCDRSSKQARPSKTKTKIATVKDSFSHGSGKGPCRRQVGERQFLGSRAAAVPPPGASRGIQHTRQFGINLSLPKFRFWPNFDKKITNFAPNGRAGHVLR